MTVTIIMDTRGGAREQYPLKYRVYLPKQKRFDLHSGFTIPSDSWDGDKVTRHPQRELINRTLRMTLANIEAALLAVHAAGAIRFPVAQVKRMVLAHLEGKDVEEPQPESFINHFRQYIEKKLNGSTRMIYEHTLSKIRAFDSRDLSFSDITLRWLTDFELYLKRQNLSVNGIGLHMRNVKAVFNDGLRYELVPGGRNPFRNFKIKKEKTRHRDMSVADIRVIRDYECEPCVRKYLDMFMLIFYLGGINIGDLCLLPSDCIVHGRITYRRRKTGELVTVRVEPEAQALIDRHRGKGYLLWVMDVYKDYRNFMHRLNLNLRTFGPVKVLKRGKKERAPLYPFLSTYYARHSIATIASQDLDIDDKVVDQILGHADNSLAGIYIHRRQRKAEEALRKVIDYVNSDLKHNENATGIDFEPNL